MHRFGTHRSLLLILCAAACGIGRWSWDEVARVPAPDAARDAVLVEQNGGATTSFAYDVFVVPHDAAVPDGARDPVASFYAATRNAQAYGVNLRWLSGDTLALEYLAAREAVVHDSVLSRRPDRLRVVLRPGITDPNAPSGGMLYNREHRGGRGASAR